MFCSGLVCKIETHSISNKSALRSPKQEICDTSELKLILIVLIFLVTRNLIAAGFDLEFKRKDGFEISCRASSLEDCGWYWY